MSFTTYGDYAARTRDSFDRQAAMRTLGIAITDVAPGRVWLTLPFRADLTQQHGFLHAAVITAAMDSAAGYAAYTLMPEDAGVLTAEFKSSFLAPARGSRFNVEARVLKPGRTLIFTEAVAHAIDGAAEREIARLTATMVVVQGRADVTG
ncbi:PaaI family thioesterase [Marimonas arenosa]|uniref:Medium/long-chain acyl-CoA thioesterase YigI n=1 Tax=Marimonas arenosa TaxID=1795305 RepID=A0AAE3WAZ9_9RHOB|nr:PaaI family thioesterase [Marimonas arenosa]MDQ2088288.1 PaaI family thioesterase [Marimonas arenosa]